MGAFAIQISVARFWCLQNLRANFDSTLKIRILVGTFHRVFHVDNSEMSSFYRKIDVEKRAMLEREIEWNYIKLDYSSLNYSNFIFPMLFIFSFVNKCLFIDYFSLFFYFLLYFVECERIWNLISSDSRTNSNSSAIISFALFFTNFKLYAGFVVLMTLWMNEIVRIIDELNLKTILVHEHFFVSPSDKKNCLIPVTTNYLFEHVGFKKEFVVNVYETLCFSYCVRCVVA